AVGDENHPRRNFPRLALERRLAELSANQRHLAFGQPDFGHVLWSHRHGRSQGLILLGILADVDQLSLGRGARGVENKAFGGHGLWIRDAEGGAAQIILRRRTDDNDGTWPPAQYLAFHDDPPRARFDLANDGRFAGATSSQRCNEPLGFLR